VLDADYVEATIRSRHPRFPAWRQPIVVHFRRQPDGWTLVGVRRDTLD
jgi:hypothetical protein